MCHKLCHLFIHEFHHHNCSTDPPAHPGVANWGAMHCGGVLGVRNTCVCGPSLVPDGQDRRYHARVARTIGPPRNESFVGKVMLAPIKVAETIAKTTGSLVQEHSAEAAHQFELTPQTPTQPVFSTSGRSKRIRVGKLEIRLQHVCQRKLALGGRPAGLALGALWYRGKNKVTPLLIGKIQQKLSVTEFEALKSVTSAMPSWMSNTLFRHLRSAPTFSAQA